MHEVPTEEMEAMVRRAVRELPEQFRSRLDNVDFVVVPEDGESHARFAPRGALLGLYRGVPLARRGAYYGGTLPDLIEIFQAPLQRLARDEAHLRALVRRTVRHEIAHHFGISDRRLREIDAY